MPFTSKGADIALKRNSATGKFDFDWDTRGTNAGNPKYADDNVHRILSLLIEHRGSPGNLGWVWDVKDNRGSLLYTLKNVRKATPSQAQAFALDALQKAVDEGWIQSPTADTRRIGADRTTLVLDVGWKNPDKSTASVRVPLSV